MSYNELMAANDLINGDLIASTAQKFGIPLPIACAFVEQESNGRHMYGRDLGGVYSTVESSVVIGTSVYPRGGVILVTPENFWGNGASIRGFYNRVVVDHETSNGVGPLQITYSGFLTEARQLGYDLSKIEDAMAYGMYLLSNRFGGDFSNDKLLRVAKWYNTGNETNYQTYWYPLEVMEKYEKWKGLLSGNTQPVPQPVPEPTPSVPVESTPVVSGYRWTTDYLYVREAPSKDAKDIAVIPRYYKVDISGKIEAGWYQVYYGGKWGWASGTYLSATQPVIPPTITTSKRKKRR